MQERRQRGRWDSGHESQIWKSPNVGTPTQGSITNTTKEYAVRVNEELKYADADG